MKSTYVATIGCFDGVHRGHQLLIGKVIREASKRGLEPMVITFDRQPRELFDPSFRPLLLSTPKEKKQQLEASGITKVVILPFTRELAEMSAQQFMYDVLKVQLSVGVLVTGYDNRFGHNREEGFDDYVRYGTKMSIEVLRGDEEKFYGSDIAISSSTIRQLLFDGDVKKAAEGLSRNYSVTGRIVNGEHIGHELGFPTANLSIDDTGKLIPASGAYAVWAVISGKRMPAMMNIGTRPTFDGDHQTLEVHILEKSIGNIYGLTMTVEFVDRLRSEQRFASREALMAQLVEDRSKTIEILIKEKQ